MINRHNRLQRIEVRLTPFQVVILWLKNVLSHTYEELWFSRPREAIANSIARSVGDSLKGEPAPLIDSAVLQARQEADFLYMLVIDVNASLQRQFFEREREYFFLLAYFLATMRCPPSSITEEPLRHLTLSFVNSILLVEGAVLRTSAEHFDGHAILFSDSVIKLKQQVVLAEEALGTFNSIATLASFRTLDKKEINDGLVPDVELQVTRWSILARSETLAAFGEWSQLQANLKQLKATYSSLEDNSDNSLRDKISLPRERTSA
ncbi:MAG TPA: hypothetical protein VGS27_28205 [Candidatus Sulfotelmatobacter sp.]|nr:hypothetical protein [Candidatus Sulfotelmatobacter sp.]